MIHTNYSLINQSKTTLTFVNKGFNNLNLIKSYSKELFIKNKNVSFTKNNDNGLTKTEKDYLKKVNEDFQKEGTKLHSLTQLDLTKIPNLCKGIKVFDGWTPGQMALFSSNLKLISLQSGCPNQCGFCYINADKHISTMNWNNYTDLIDGMKEINDRLAFNPFKTRYFNSKQSNGKHFYTDNTIQLFSDSDPMSLRINTYDSNGKHKTKTIYDAALYIKEKLDIQTSIMTAGWSNNSDELNQSAAKLAKRPDLIDGPFSFSINLTQKLIQTSIDYYKKSAEAGKAGKIEEAEILEEKAEKLRSAYINMISSNVETLLNNGLPGEKIEFVAYHSNELESYSYDNTMVLVEEIFDEIRQKCPDKLDEIEKIILNEPNFNFILGRAANLKDEYKDSINFLTDLIVNYNNNHPLSPLNIDTNSISQNDSGMLDKLSNNNRDLWYKIYNTIENLELIKKAQQLKTSLGGLKPQSILEKIKGVDIYGNTIISTADEWIFGRVAKLPFKVNFQHPTNVRRLSNPQYVNIPNEMVLQVFNNQQ